MVKIEFNFETLIWKLEPKDDRRHIGSTLTVKKSTWKDADVDKWSKEEFRPVASMVLGTVAEFMEKGRLPTSDMVLEKIIAKYQAQKLKELGI